MKATGKQWNAFLASWPEGWWYDDDDVTINGVSTNDHAEAIKDADKIELTIGVIYEDTERTKDLVRQFRKWIKAQNCNTFVVEIPKTVDTHHFKTRLALLFGGKVVGD